MRKWIRMCVLVTVMVSLLLIPATPASSQVGEDALANCAKYAFSTEEDFMTQGPEPPDGDPLISDGDLLGADCTVCARNADLLREFDVTVDLGLDAADVLSIEQYVVAFSTELDSPHGDQFTAGDLLITPGALLGRYGVIPNRALTYRFEVRYDVGLDGVHFVGQSQDILSFLGQELSEWSRDDWLEEPEMLATLLERYGVDIWFSTEGTAEAFLDGDVLSARDGTIVASNGDLLPNNVPAGLPKRGVDFGADAFTADRGGTPELLQFSTEILYDGEMSFTDGDLLQFKNGVVMTNEDLVRCFEPAALFLGLDAFSIPGAEREPCDAAIIRVGGMAVGSIGANGLANGMSTTTPPFTAEHSPFGGTLEIIGLMPDCEECETFKVEYGEWSNPTTPPTSWTPITDDFTEWRFIWPSWYVHVDREPDADGYLDILCDTVMGGLYMPWSTAGRDGKYSIRLTIRDTGGTEHTSSPVVVMLDNTKPTAMLDVATTPVCGDIFAGDIVTGTLTATDTHFYSYRLRYASSLANGLIIDPIRTYTGLGDTGDTNVSWSWDTTGLPACGYRIILEVWDRTIVNNDRPHGSPGFGWRRALDQYFCLEEAAE